MFDRVTIPRLVVASLSSGAGKTTVSLGLVTALRARGRAVQTFKVGPDFIDSSYLAHASRRPCRNLDAWVLDEPGVARSLERGAVGADCAIVEGADGLFDGHSCSYERWVASPHPFTGSTAEVAGLIRAPVVLVIDVAAMGQTAAAVALGVKAMEPSLDLVGVVLDRVPSDHRRRVVEDAVWRRATLPVLGALPVMPPVHIPELRDRLLPLAENPQVDAALDQLAATAERECDLDLIERLMARAEPLAVRNGDAPAATATSVRVGVGFDEGFCFYYPDNLELLEEAGAEIVPFSPLEDRELPGSLDAVYLAGGMNERLLPRLAANRGFLGALRAAWRDGIMVYAESGGVLACARAVCTGDGTWHEMAGLLPVDLGLDAGDCHTGYRELTVASDGPLGIAGQRLRGHEFHHSRVITEEPGLEPAYSMHDCDGEPLGCEGWMAPGLVASFVQLHFGQAPSIAARLVDAARDRGRQGRGDALLAMGG